MSSLLLDIPKAKERKVSSLVVGEIGLIFSSEISDQPDQNTDLSVERGKLFAIKSILLCRFHEHMSTVIAFSS